MESNSRGLRALWLGCALLAVAACSAKAETGTSSSGVAAAGPSTSSNATSGAGGETAAGPGTGGVGGEGGEMVTSVSVGPGGGMPDPGPGEGEMVWARGYGGPDLDSAVIAVDQAADIWVVGHYFDQGSVGGQTFPAAYPSNIMIAKLNDLGDHQWSQHVGGAGQDKARAVAVNSKGEAVVVGYFENTAVFGGPTLESQGGRDAFITKVDDTGATLWSRRIGGTGHDALYSVAVDSMDNVVVAGYFSGVVTIGSTTLTSDGGFDGFAAKIGDDGTVFGGQRFGGSGQDVAFGVAIGQQNEVGIVGSCSTGCDVSGTSLMGQGKMFVVKNDAQGNLLWAHRYGGGGRDVGNAVVFDPATGDMIVGGYFTGSADWGNGFDAPSAGDRDAFVARYAAMDGSHVWSNTFGGTGRDEVRALSVDIQGDIGVSGYAMNEVDFGAGPTPAEGSLDSFILKLPPNGSTPIWIKRLGGAEWDQGTSLAVDTQTRAIVAAGTFSDTVDFGLGPVNAAGEEDIYVLRISAGEETVIQ